MNLTLTRTSGAALRTRIQGWNERKRFVASRINGCTCDIGRRRVPGSMRRSRDPIDMDGAAGKRDEHTVANGVPDNGKHRIYDDKMQRQPK